jgi:membrane protein implicated in regulation of membrane protease activity
MLTNLIELAVAIGGAGMVALAVKQARGKGWAGSLQMAAGGFLLIGAAAIGIVGFLAGIVFNPLAWLGVVALGIAGVLFVAGQRLEGRSAGRKDTTGTAEGKAVKGGGQATPKPRAVEGKSAQPAVDDDLAEIEEILRRRGIQ